MAEVIRLRGCLLPRRDYSRPRRCRSIESGESGLPYRQTGSLSEIIERKQRELSTRLQDIGEEEVMDRLASCMKWENPNPHRFAQLVSTIKMQKGRPILIFELGPSTEMEESLAEQAKSFEESFADGLCVPIDEGVSSVCIKDLFVVSNSVKIPIFARDWFIHPLQILDAKEAGASGLIGIVASVSKTGTHLLSGFAAAIGLDSPVEVVNIQEVEEMERLGIPMYSVNVSVGLSLSGISGIASQIASGILSALPLGAVSLIGVRSMEEARQAAEAGADGLLIRSSFIPKSTKEIPNFVQELMYITSGDD